MAKYLQDVRIWVPPSTNESKPWGYSTNFLTYLYMDCLPKVESDGLATVVFIPCRMLPEKPFKLEINPDGYSYSKLFNFDLYFKSSKEAKKRMALDFLQDGILEVAKIREWSTKPFLEAYKAILAKNFVYYHPWSKTISSPNRKYKAQVWCNFDSDKAEIFIVFFHRKEIVGKTLVTTVKPGGVWIREAVGKLEWVSPEKVKLTSKDGKQSWEAALEQKNEPTRQPYALTMRRVLPALLLLLTLCASLRLCGDVCGRGSDWGGPEGVRLYILPCQFSERVTQRTQLNQRTQRSQPIPPTLRRSLLHCPPKNNSLSQLSQRNLTSHPRPCLSIQQFEPLPPNRTKSG